MNPLSVTDDVALVLDRRRQQLLEALPRSDQTALARWCEQLTAGGAWPDVDYGFRPNAGGMDAVRHLERLRALALAWADEVSPRHRDPAVRGVIERGLGHWRDCDPRSPIWWFNDIGVPLALGPTLTLLRAELPADLLAWGLGRMRSGWRAGDYRIAGNDLPESYAGERDLDPRHAVTGQNRVWLAGHTFTTGCLARDAEEIARSVGHIAGELRRQPVGAEGIQHDLSFHQHGPMLYTGGYGMSLAGDLTEYAVLLDGTRWAFSREQLVLLADFLLVGVGWAVWGNGIDHGVLGRNHTRRLAPALPGLARMCEQLAPLVPERAAALRETAALRTDPPAPGPARGNRHFPRSDWMVHRRETFHASVRMVSDRVRATESGNGEGLQNYHVADGATQFLRRGDEYLAVAPLWNWRQVPGVTAAQTSGPLPQFPWGVGSEGLTPWAAGASDGERGVAAFRSLRDGVEIWKSWFFLGDSVVCLGAGLRVAPGVTAEILTAVDQRESPADASVWVGERDGSRREWTEGQAEFPAPAWVWHDGIAYAFDHDAAPRLRCERVRRQGSSAVINAMEPPRVVDATMFSLNLVHGVGPAASGGYAYAMFPAGSPDLVSRWPRPLVLANSPEVQAMASAGGDAWLVAFHAPGAVRLTGEVTLGALQPAVVIVRRETSGNGFSFQAAHPELRVRRLEFTLNGTRLTIPCNSSPELAGVTVSSRVVIAPGPS